MKTPNEIYEKFKNFGHHNEFEASGITIEKIKEKISNKEIFYDHFADKSSSFKWDSNYKLKKADKNLLPIYLNDNRENLKDWFDK